MRIMICMNHLSPWSSGLARALTDLGHHVHVFDFSTYKKPGMLDPQIPGILSDFRELRLRLAGVHLVRPLSHGYSRFLLAIPVFRRLLRKLQIDMVLTLYSGGFGLLAYLSGFRPYCVYVVGSDVLLVPPIARMINRMVWRNASQVFANGEYLAAQARYQSPRALIQTLLIGIRPAMFHQADFRRRPIRFICTRGFEPIYNNEAILRALTRMPEDVPDFEVIFVSGGDHLPEMRELAERILPQIHKKRVKFWGGVSHRELVEGLEQSHFLLSMSRSDGTSTSVLEGMACGLYPIISDIPQNHSLIPPGGENGRLAPLDDIDALTATMQWAMCHVDECARQSAINRSFVEQYADQYRNQLILSQRLEAIALNLKRRNSF